MTYFMGCSSTSVIWSYIVPPGKMGGTKKHTITTPSVLGPPFTFIPVE
jgi:hypothetical protein